MARKERKKLQKTPEEREAEIAANVAKLTAERLEESRDESHAAK